MHTVDEIESHKVLVQKTTNHSSLENLLNQTPKKLADAVKHPRLVFSPHLYLLSELVDKTCGVPQKNFINLHRDCIVGCSLVTPISPVSGNKDGTRGIQLA